MGKHQPSYLFSKRGIFYFVRRVPEDLLEHYLTPRIVLSLRTRSATSARAESAQIALKLDQEWKLLRQEELDQRLSRFRIDKPSIEKSSHSPLLSEAMQFYLREKSGTRGEGFERMTERSVGYAIGAMGDKPIDLYSRTDINLFRDQLRQQGQGNSTIRRVFASVRAVMNFCAREHDIDEPKALKSVYLGEEEKQEKRKPIPLPVIRRIQQECYRLDDQSRWVIALISETGMRLSEAIGLHSDDIFLDHEYPHLRLRERPWRSLKTPSSERSIPVFGASLWALQRASEASSKGLLFPHFCTPEGVKNNSASAALNKWMKPRVPNGCVIHSFRHSFRDRLRSLGCPTELIDQLGGWKRIGIGSTYGEGYHLSSSMQWIRKIAQLET
jgi:integrase